jgi:hypothetical protein
MRVAIKGIQGYARVSRDASYLMRGAITSLTIHGNRRSSVLIRTGMRYVIRTGMRYVIRCYHVIRTYLSDSTQDA